MTVTLADLAALLDARAPGVQRRGDARLTDATHDSRQAAPGVLFCAVRGRVTDGHTHAPSAVERGASALLVERWLPLDVPQLRVGDTRALMGIVAAAVHDDPSRHVRLVGITGTNGKTTTAYLVEGAMAAAGWSTGLIGTVETRIDGAAIAGVRTTPEGTDLQRMLATMRDRGVDGVAMEVSSHGLDLHRVTGTHLHVAVFTNLTQDHLDFHGTMDAYARAKARLLTPELAGRAIVDVQAPWGPWMAERAQVPTVTVGDVDADVVRTEVSADLGGTTMRLTGPADVVGGDGTVEVTTRLLGTFNGHNATLAHLASVAVGVPADASLLGIAAAPGAPGRLQRVDVGGEITALVDYAHTPDAVRTVVDTLRRLMPDGARLLVVLGAGGDRDRAKRPLMGAAAAEADVAVLTSDNPRSENPDAILRDVVEGARMAQGQAHVHVEPDRRRAIALALAEARAGDLVLVAGKGHETGQQFADRIEPFDDCEVLREAAGARVEGAA